MTHTTTLDPADGPRIQVTHDLVADPFGPDQDVEPAYIYRARCTECRRAVGFKAKYDQSMHLYGVPGAAYEQAIWHGLGHLNEAHDIDLVTPEEPAPTGDTP